MGCPMSAASPVAGALLPAPCSVWDPRRRAPQELSLHARLLSHSHSSPPRLAPPAAQAPFTPRRSPARPSRAPVHPEGTFGVPTGRRCPQGCGVNRQAVGMGLQGSSVVCQAGGAVPAVGGCSASCCRAMQGYRVQQCLGWGGCGVQCQPGTALWGTVSLAAGTAGCSGSGDSGLWVWWQAGRVYRVQWWLGGGLWGAAAGRAEDYGVQWHQGQGLGVQHQPGRGCVPLGGGPGGHMQTGDVGCHQPKVAGQGCPAMGTALTASTPLAPHPRDTDLLPPAAPGTRIRCPQLVPQQGPASPNLAWPVQGGGRTHGAGLGQHSPVPPESTLPCSKTPISFPACLVPGHRSFVSVPVPAPGAEGSPCGAGLGCWRGHLGRPRWP